MWYLYFRLEKRGFVQVWLPLAVGASTVAFLAGIKRAEEFGMEVALFSSWYTTPLFPYWTAVVLSGIVIIQTEWQSVSKLVRSPLSLVNTLLIAWVILNYPFTVTAAFEQPRSVYYRVSSQNTECIMRIVIQQIDQEPCPFDAVHKDIINQLALRKLVMFANIQPQTLIETSNETIVVATKTDWSAVHIRDFYLHDVPQDEVTYVYEQTSENLPEIAQPPATTPIATLEDQSSFWLITTEPYLTENNAISEEIIAAGFTIEETTPYDYGITISKISRP
jgi:hypothetical protein